LGERERDVIGNEEYLVAWLMVKKKTIEWCYERKEICC